MNNENNKYNRLFKIAKKDYLVKHNSTIDCIEATHNKISLEIKRDIIKYSKIANQEFKKLEKEKGLCIPLSICLLEVSALLTQERYAFVTIGRIVDSISKQDIFLVGEKENLLKKYNPEKIGINMHAWITLSDGTIIDPSIDLGSGLESLIIGSPEDISNKYIYSPYLIVALIENKIDVFDTNELEDIFYKKIESLKDNFQVE